MVPPQPTPTDPITISVRTASLMSDLSEWEIREEMNKGVIPAVRHGKRVLVDYDGFRAWLKGLPPVTEVAS